MSRITTDNNAHSKMNERTGCSKPEVGHLSAEARSSRTKAQSRRKHTWDQEDRRDRVHDAANVVNKIKKERHLRILHTGIASPISDLTPSCTFESASLS